MKKEPLKLVSFCNERLILVSDSFIYVFALNQNQSDDLGAKTTSLNRSFWSLEEILEVDFPVECLSTNRFGDRFIVGGTYCQMFRYKNFSEENKHWKSVWKEDMPTPVRSITISPDDRLFATLSDPQIPLVKIWYKSFSTMRNNYNVEHYSFLYLKHKKPILSMEWRSKEIIDHDYPNVLMTYSEDCVQRFWVETSLSEELHFHISTSNFKPNVHATHFLCTPHELSPNEVITTHAISSRIDVGDAGHQDLFSLPVEVDKGIVHEPTAKLKSESQTWIITIFTDGSVGIDLINGLADQPRRTPSTSSWIRLFDVFPTGIDLQKDYRDILIFYTCGALFSNPYYNGTTFISNNLNNVGCINIGNSAPSILTIYSLSAKGRISNYTLPISIDQNLIPSNPLHLNSFITGHKKSITKVLAHPVLPLAASYDFGSKTLLFWHIRGSPYFNPPHILTHIFEVNDIEISDFTWLPNQSALFISTPNGIEILNIRSKRPEVYNFFINKTDPLQQMDSDRNTIFPPIPGFYSFQTDDIVDGSEEFSMSSYMKILSFTSDENNEETSPVEDEDEPESAEETYLVALSEDKLQIGFWRIDVAKGSFQNQFTAPLTINFVLKKLFMEKISCMDCRIVTPFVLEQNNTISEYNIVLVFGTEDGKISCYSVQKDSISAQNQLNSFKSGLGIRKNSVSLNNSFTFQAHDEPIVNIKCCEQISKIATITSKGDHVTIWDAESKNSIIKEQSILFTNGEIATQICWFSYGAGDRTLLIGTNECIHNFSQTRSDLSSTNDLWEEVAILEKNQTTQACTSISITKERTILTAFGKNLHAYTKWLQIDKSICGIDEYYITKIRKLNRRLPDYHPKFLEDLLMTGNIKMVRDIFIHVAFHLKNENNCDELYIPSLPINFFKMETKVENKPTIQKRTTLLDKFKKLSLDSDSDEDLEFISNKTSFSKFGNNKIKKNKDEKININENNMPSYVELETNITFEEAYKELVNKLAKQKLPELNSIDQMNLIAILDTFHKIQNKPEALDEPAIRFYVAFNIAHYLEKSNKNIGISFAHIAWMMLSETQDAFIRMLSLNNSGKLDWNYVKKLGIPFWMNDINQLRELAQQMARDRFSQTNDPSVCALIYLVLGKKSTLTTLYKAIGDEKIAKFLNRDFDPNASPNHPSKINCVLAAKNAYKLIGQHKFEYAAAFFFLSGNLKDTLDILVKKVDIFMAYFIMRIYKGDTDPETIDFVNNTFIPYIINNINDLWIQSIANWRIRNYENSLKILCNLDKIGDNFDGSLYSYCEFVSKKPQLLSCNIFDRYKSRVLLLVCHYFLRSGALVLALENLKKLNGIENTSIKTTSCNYIPEDSMEIMSGALDMSSFGMGGFSVGQNYTLNSFNNYNSQIKTNKDVEKDSNSIIENNKKLTQQLTFLSAISFMTQELDDLFKKPNPSPNYDWDMFLKRIQEETLYLYESFNVNRLLLNKKMKEYCRLNGRIVSKCILSPNEDIVSVIQRVTYPAVALLSKMQHSILSKNHVQLTNSFTSEFVFCYERCLKIGKNIPLNLRADWGICIYSLMFVSFWSAGDYTALRLLINLPYKMYNNEETPNAFYHTIMFQMPEFYHKFFELLKQENENEKIEEQLQNEELLQKKKYFYGKASSAFSSISLDIQNNGIKSEHDTQIEKLKRDFFDIMFEAVLISTYVDNAKYTLQQAYASENLHSLYSITAKTILSSITLWYSCILDKLQYKQLELYAARKQLSRRSFRDVGSLSFTSSNSLLSNLVKTLVFSARQTNKRKTSQLHRDGSSADFSSIIHAIPDLHQEEQFYTRSQINELLDDSDIKDAKFINKKQKLWKYLVTLTFPESTWNETSENINELNQQSSIVFSHPIEIVKCKEPIKAFCINRSQPQYLTFATQKLIREINIEHSIKFRKRNSTFQKLLDDEMPTWSESIHRFDNLEHESDINRISMSRKSVETVSHFLDYMDEYPTGETPPKSTLEFCSQGMGTNVNSHKPLWKKAAKKIKRAHRTRVPTFSGNADSHIQNFRSSKRLSEGIDHRVSVSVLISHPTLPFYLSGGIDGSIYLWQFQQEHPIRVYKPAGGPSIVNIKFGAFGFKFGAVNDKGDISLWRFDSSKDSIQEFDRLHCHIDKTIDFTFLNSGSLLATIGLSNSVKELCIWDVLLPEHESILAKEILDEEPTCISYAPHFDYILVGCKKGEIIIYSMIGQRIVKTLTLENKIIENITMDSAEDFFVVGCSDGDLIVYDLNSLMSLSSFKSNHKKPGIRFLGDSAAGVSKSEVMDYYLYSSGADGRILRRCFVE